MTDDELIDRFTSCTLTAVQFKHAEHLRVAWIFLQRHDFDDAVARSCAGIGALASHLGAPDKFHWTITVVMLRLLRAYGAADPSLAWPAFSAAHPQLLNGARELLARHYSEALLGSIEARRAFVAPDLAALPT